MTFEYCPKCGEKLIPKSCGDEGEVPFCSNCSRPFFPFSYPCVICLCISEDNSEIALIKQSYGNTGRFVNVAGYIKNGEAAENAVLREIREEIGLDAVKIQFIKSYYHEKGDNLMLGYACKVRKDKFRLSDEVKSAEWFPIEEGLNALPDGSIAWKLLNDYINNERNEG